MQFAAVFRYIKNTGTTSVSVLIYALCCLFSFQTAITDSFGSHHVSERNTHYPFVPQKNGVYSRRKILFQAAYQILRNLLFISISENDMFFN